MFHRLKDTLQPKGNSVRYWVAGRVKFRETGQCLLGGVRSDNFGDQLRLVEVRSGGANHEEEERPRNDVWTHKRRFSNNAFGIAHVHATPCTLT